MFSKLCHDHPEPVVTAEILPLCKGTVMHESTRGIGRRSAGMHGIEPAICNREKVSLQQVEEICIGESRSSTSC